MKIYGTIEKMAEQDDGTIIVSGYASAEVVDCDGETITSKAMAAALPDYMKFANIREMHQPKAAGVALKAETQDDGRTFLEAHIVDSEAVKKVKAGVYKGYSIGGRITERDEANKSIITGIRLSEISLVDRPANPQAVFECWKGDGIEKQEADAPAETSTEAPTEAPQVDEAGKAEKAEVKKGMYSVARLAAILDSLSDLEYCAEREAGIEGDSSPVPAQLTEAVKGLCAILRNMVAEETSELESEESGEVVALAETNEDLEKAGARNSKKDKQMIQTVHDNAVTLGADCASEKAEETTDLKKVTEEKDALKKSFDDLKKVTESLEKRVKELEAMPAPAKAVLKAVDKTDDTSIVEKNEPEPTDTLGLIKKAHKSGTRLM